MRDEKLTLSPCHLVSRSFCQGSGFRVFEIEIKTKTPRYQILIARGFVIFPSILILFKSFKFRSFMSFMSFMSLAFPLVLHP
jgi:hypothetical protein